MFSTSLTPKLAYRLKAGLSYQLSPEISAFAGRFYHHVVGDGVYDYLPAQLQCKSQKT
ncbi:Major surface antigen 4 precursor [Anaplasma phagocytophilum]|uniref:Surface antigen family protein n=1 Tax=Anaplasma phagocytophilum str. ApMUC09 TaxID=1359152 RepID=A0A0F3N987_ANAPH|nr:surface antigen family protein [Anaplasma phagocytophilum str. ApMUC09]SCV64273.1 Major surface antigen 4 precursor [Anaplasma phagocytophilum]